MKVTYSPRAVADLVEIGSYLAERSPRGAAAVEHRIHKVIELLADFPASGRLVEARPSVRVMPLATYPFLVFYTASEAELTVLHIRHAAREPIDPPEI
ncbi:MAG: type II toxin-antitoxin system RelE/ParE family toxin [Methyloceanibacter sp.]